MSSADEVQALLRFLTKDAKLPLAEAMKAIHGLRKAELSSAGAIASSSPKVIQTVVHDDKLAKQILNAARRSVKRAGSISGSTDNSPLGKKGRINRDHSHAEMTPDELESSLVLPELDATEDEMVQTVISTNRAPLVVAFVVTLLRYTMPEQPLSSRLSLAQAYMSINARSKAVSIGLESGRSAEEDGFGKGQPIVNIMGREIRVMKRWDYDWKPSKETTSEEAATSTNEPEKSNGHSVKEEFSEAKAAGFQVPAVDSPVQPPLWAIDLEAVKRSSSTSTSKTGVGLSSNLPIYTPQSARSYLLKSFGSAKSAAEDPDGVKRATTVASTQSVKERNLGLLLNALSQVYKSWHDRIGAQGLDQRTWAWYLRVRPAVADGAAGWGGKNEVKLSDILALRAPG